MMSGSRDDDIIILAEGIVVCWALLVLEVWYKDVARGHG